MSNIVSQNLPFISKITYKTKNRMEWKPSNNHKKGIKIGIFVHYGSRSVYDESHVLGYVIFKNGLMCD